MLLAIALLAALFLIDFTLGSIPWGVVISKVFYRKDLRDEGSGNIGTTNAFRSMGKKGGVAVFVLDFGKGLAAGALGLLWISVVCADNPATGLPIVTPLLVGLGFDKIEAVTYAYEHARGICMALAFAGCTLGHIFSPWLGWKGGKGIAVAAACLVFVFGPVGFLIEIACFVVGIAVTRCVSVGSLAAAVACPLLALYYYWGQWGPWLIIAATAGVVIWAHRANIQRLRAGTENKIGSKKKAEA